MPGENMIKTMHGNIWSEYMNWRRSKALHRWRPKIVIIMVILFLYKSFEYFTCSSWWHSENLEIRVKSFDTTNKPFWCDSTQKSTYVKIL